jgi:NADP-dependent 3-hydroxy acid dehydrogenase YdfG
MKRRAFRDAIAIVTGASSGIGRALALELSRRGAIVYAAGRDEGKLAALAADGEGRVVPVVLDVTDEPAVKALCERVAREQGKLDYVFNNAGVLLGGDFEKMDREAWSAVLDVNLWGTIHGTHHAYAIMRRQGHGHIVNTASTAGLVPVARSAAYTATKHAVVGLSLALREEGRAHGVRVSCTIPGLVDTAIFGRSRNLEGYDYEAAMRGLPIRKITPEAAARATLRGVAQNRQLIVYPFYNRVLWGLMRWSPALTSWLVNVDVTGSGLLGKKAG